VAPPQLQIGGSSRGRRMRSRTSPIWLCLPLSVALLLDSTGCSRLESSKSPESQAAQERAAEHQARKAALTKEDEARQALEEILPPSKNLYLGVRDRNAYENPFLVVNRDTITLRIMFPDKNPQGFGTGGMLRPAAARRQQLEVRLADLPEALSSLPPEVWPYGRVVAVQEPPAPRAARVAIRRNEEATIQVLNDLGVVVDEWTGANGTLLR
jgi:hypothetical protein